MPPITFVRPGRVGEVLIAEAVERMHAGRSGMYDVRVSTVQGELVAEFRGHTRSIRGRSEV
jgi:acyl-CoA thioesterase